jgi:hypothetical protein
VPKVHRPTQVFTSPPSPDQCHSIPTRTIGGYEVKVGSPYYDDTTLQHILNSLTFASDLDDSSTWWSLQDALANHP